MYTVDAALPRFCYSLSVVHWGACSHLTTLAYFLVALGSLLSYPSAYRSPVPRYPRSLPPSRQLGPPSLAVASVMPVFALRLHLPYTPCMPVPALRPPLPCHAVPPSSVHARVQLASALSSVLTACAVLSPPFRTCTTSASPGARALLQFGL